LKPVDDSIEDLRAMPEIGVRIILRNPALSGLRAWPVKAFEDLRVYYLIQSNTLRVIRVLHGKRDIQRILRDEF
jgi:toxin ParE1/3/4